MIFYGSKSSEIGTGKLRNVTCPHCQNNVEMNFSVFGRYSHVYWIPFFPIGKENILECNSCKSTYHLKDLPETIKQKFNQDLERNPIKTPISHFSLTFLTVIGIAIATFFSFKSDSDTKDFAKTPKVGDIFYETTAPKGWFSTSKITRVTKDSIFVMQNNLESEKKEDVDEQATEDKNYTMPYQFSRKKYQFLVEKDSVYKITRK